MRKIQSLPSLSHRSAFTLLQLMLIIALITFISVMTFDSGKQQHQQQRLQRLAVEIQRYLEASTQYYKHHAQWPSSADDLILADLLPGMPSDQDRRLNPWGFAYRLNAVNGSRGDVFAIETRVPPAALRLQLQQWLPNVTYDGETVSAAITTSGKVDDLIFVGSEEDIESKQDNDCPGSQTGCLSWHKQQHYESLCRNEYGRRATFEVALQSFSAGRIPGWWSDAKKETVGMESYYDFYDVGISKSIVHNRWGYNITLDRQNDADSAGHDGQAVMFIYCMPIHS